MKKIFVFGSNVAGIHGAGAAKTAYEKYGARWGMGYGLYGESFAIPTKDRKIETLPIYRIKNFIDGFIAFAHESPELTFQVTRIGCGLAGLSDRVMADLFFTSRFLPKNCYFDTKWEMYLPSGVNFWGTYA